jgi:hypothetical protein
VAYSVENRENVGVRCYLLEQRVRFRPGYPDPAGMGGTPPRGSSSTPREPLAPVTQERDDVLGEDLGDEVDRDVLLAVEDGDAHVR